MNYSDSDISNTICYLFNCLNSKGIMMKWWWWKSVKSLRLPVILPDELGSILERNGLSLPSTWLSSFRLFCTLMNSTFFLFRTNFSCHSLSVQLHFLRLSSITSGASLFSLTHAVIPSILSFSKVWCVLIMCPKYRIFWICVRASNLMFGLNFC